MTYEESLKPYLPPPILKRALWYIENDPLWVSDETGQAASHIVETKICWARAKEGSDFWYEVWYCACYKNREYPTL